MSHDPASVALPPPDPAVPESLESDLCRGCGLCCSGAIFDYGPLDPSELPLVERGILRPAAERVGFDQPCRQLVGTACGIYAQRPGTCRRYRCTLLNGFAAGEVEHGRAQEIVAQAVKLAGDALALGPGALSLPDLRRRLHAREDDWSTADPDERMAKARARLAIAALERYLDGHFRRPHQRRLHEDASGTDPVDRSAPASSRHA